jgi:hypothetical protein
MRQWNWISIAAFDIVRPVSPYSATARPRMRTRTVRLSLITTRLRHGQVADGGLGMACKVIRDDRAMALGVVALIAQERNGAGGGPG